MFCFYLRSLFYEKLNRELRKEEYLKQQINIEVDIPEKAFEIIHCWLIRMALKTHRYTSQVCTNKRKKIKNSRHFLIIQYFFFFTYFKKYVFSRLPRVSQINNRVDKKSSKPFEKKTKIRLSSSSIRKIHLSKCRVILIAVSCSKITRAIIISCLF